MCSMWFATVFAEMNKVCATSFRQAARDEPEDLDLPHGQSGGALAPAHDPGAEAAPRTASVASAS